MHPQIERGSTAFAHTKLMSATSRANKGTLDYVGPDGRRAWCVFKRYEPWQWTLMYTVPLDVKYADARGFISTLVAITTCFGGGALLITIAILARMMRPIVTLTEVSQDMAHGDLDREINIKASDEVAVLTQSFLTMRDAIREKIESLNKEIATRAAAEEELARHRDHLDKLVTERTRQLEKIHEELVIVSRKAGMSEVATGVLHNVGNILNSVNVAANFVEERIAKLRAGELKTAADIIAEHIDDMGRFVTEHPAGQASRPVPDRNGQTSGQRAGGRVGRRGQSQEKHRPHQTDRNDATVLCERIRRGPAGQSTGTDQTTHCTSARPRSTGITSMWCARSRTFPRSASTGTRCCRFLSTCWATPSMPSQGIAAPAANFNFASHTRGTDRIRISITDNGIGIQKQDLARVFQFGFTTKADGHGFGLHASALAAKEMGGSLTAESEGEGHGATFVLELPIQAPNTNSATSQQRPKPACDVLI